MGRGPRDIRSTETRTSGVTVYGQPFFLEDKTGDLQNLEFVDIHERMKLTYRCTHKDSTGTTYMIYDTTSGSMISHMNPLFALTFGENNTLGTIALSLYRDVPMNDYLAKSSLLGSSRDRKFVASDNQEYRWRWRQTNDQEWTCTNSRNYLVAYYSLKLPVEPEHRGSSGCMLTIDEPFQYLAPELLASLMIMCHIAAYRL
ncbi:hypothetical protein BDQ17DRAFT_1502044 [Cyathus striatus]|nr:hypothetical protein BDQ17DRAFT_1502044 [Cyathus striatus]